MIDSEDEWDEVPPETEDPDWKEWRENDNS